MNPKKTFFQPRRTINSVPSRDLQTRSVSATRSNKPQKNFNELQITKNIWNVLQMCSTQNRRLSPGIITGLKPSQKSFISTLTSFLRQFDPQLQSKDIETNMLMQIFTLLGYPNKIMQSVFQPIGAPHTWGLCLGMLEWLSQITHYHIEEKRQPAQVRKGNELDELILEAYQHQLKTGLREQNKIESFIENRKRQLEKQYEKITFINENLNLQIKNIKNSQKQLSQVKSELQNYEQRLKRQCQLVTSYDQQLNKIQRETQELQDKIKQSQYQNDQIRSDIKKHQQLIAKQELTVYELEKLTAQKKQFENRKKKLIVQNFEKSEEYIKTCNKIMQKIFQMETSLEIYKKKLKQYNSLPNHKNTDGLNIQVNRSSIQKYLIDSNKQEKQQFDKLHVYSIQKIKLKIDKIIDETVKQQQQLHHKFLKMKQEKREWVKNIQIQQQQNKSNSIKKISLQQTINVLKSQQLNLQFEFNKLISQKQQLQNEIKKIKQQSLNSQQKINNKLNQFQQLLMWKNNYQINSKKTYNQLFQQAKKHKQTIVKTVKDQLRGFKKLNQTIDIYFQEQLNTQL